MSEKPFDIAQVEIEWATIGNLIPSEIEKSVDELRSKIPKLLHKKSELTKLISLIDLTSLSSTDTRKTIDVLVDDALCPVPEIPSLSCYAVCVYPAHILNAKNRMKERGKVITIASVASGFPSGQYMLNSRNLEIVDAVESGATEIDVVINRGAALDGDWNTVYNELSSFKRSCSSAKMKTIIATSELKDFECIFKASWVALLSGSDFAKTSSGKENDCASYENTYVMCMAIKRFFQKTGRRVGLKVAGGVKLVEDALFYRLLVDRILGREWLEPNLFRIGASSLLDNIRDSLKECDEE